MPIRKRNMLEAFQASKQSPSEEGAGYTQEGAPAAGPFAQKPAAAPAATTSIEEIEAELKRRETNDGWTIRLNRSTLGPLVLSQLILLALVYWAGRLSVDAVQAEEPEAAGADAEQLGLLQPPPQGGAPPAGPRETAPQGRAEEPAKPATEPATAAFYDTKNRYTLCAIQYPNTKQGESLAWDVYEYLQTQGLPVVRPVRKRSFILVCVGATVAQDDLAALKDRLRRLRGPDPTRDARPFRDAYVVNIDDQVQR